MTTENGSFENTGSPANKGRRRGRETIALLAATLLAAAVIPVAASALQKEQPTAPPTFRDVSVHDPAIIKADDTFYVFGSHLAAAKSKDLMAWDLVAADVNERNPLFNNVREELKETFTWAESRTLWAPDVIQLKDGRFYMYYDACKGDSPRSALGLAVADKIEGPYKDQGILLKSGMWGQPSEDGAVYEPRVHPNVVDPDAFFDNDGTLWMVYGSYSGGIFILKMDSKTGKPLPGQGYGKKLLGGNHSRIEGPCILYHPRTKYYYLYLSYGGLDSRGGYNIRVARSRKPDGPYQDAEGKAMVDVKADASRPLFDDRSIEGYGTKLMGNFQFTGKTGDTGAENGHGYVSPGHNSAYYDPRSGKQFLILHTRFPGRGEFHQVRVHQVLMNRDEWPVIAPYWYAGESVGKVKHEEVLGEYRFVNHGKAITTDIARSQALRLEPDGTVTGAAQGTWEHRKDNQLTLVLDGTPYDGILLRQWEPDTASFVLTFSVLSKLGVALWGSKNP